MNAAAQFSPEAIDAAVTEAVATMPAAAEVVAEVAAVVPAIAQIALLGDKASHKELVQKLNEIVDTVNKLVEAQKTPAAAPTATRNRGPVSEKQMTEADAKRIMLEDYKDKSHKICATELGLSYGQVYSARKGFTFKAIYKVATANGSKW